MQGHKLKIEDCLPFILAGNSTVTFKNSETSNRFTFKVTKNKNNDIYFVKVLTNPDTYTFIGSINNKIYKHSTKSGISNSAQSVKVFNWVLSKLISGTLPDFIEIWHEGRCGRCGRELTVPSSIASGFGPECIKKINKK